MWSLLTSTLEVLLPVLLFRLEFDSFKFCCCFWIELAVTAAETATEAAAATVAATDVVVVEAPVVWFIRILS